MSHQMNQKAPWPKALEDVIDELSYKADWEFSLDDDYDRGQGSRGLTFNITITVPNSQDETKIFRVRHLMIVPAASFNRRSWIRWIFDQIMLVEKHEAMEFFKIGGHRPYAPNHGPGNDPYYIWELGSIVDARTDQHGIERNVEV